MRFKTLRILILLVILAMIAHSQFSARERFASWQAPVFVAIYPVNASSSDAVARYIALLDEREYASIVDFVGREAERYDIGMRRPLYLQIGDEVHETLPDAPVGGSFLQRAGWVLKARWWRWRFDDQGLDPDIVVLARYHDPRSNSRLPHSTGIEDLRIAIANLFATREMQAENSVVLLHEVLHTLGASDKYDLQTGQPFFPDGYAEPQRNPRHPQRFAELMAGRVPVSSSSARQAAGLSEVKIGPKTAAEIGWADSPRE